MTNPLVIINPGHFRGRDSGACGNGLQEADITLDIGNWILSLAPNYGFDVVLVYANDLNEICTQANKYRDAALFVSIHVNAGGGTGYEDFCYTEQSIEANRLRSLMRIDIMNFYRSFGFGDRGPKHKNLAVLKDTDMPAALTENLFIDNARDAAKLADPLFIQGIAAAHAAGIARALGTGYKKGGVIVPEWAVEAVEWAYLNGLITDKSGDENFYRNIVVLYRYHKRFLTIA